MTARNIVRCILFLAIIVDAVFVTSQLPSKLISGSADAGLTAASLEREGKWWTRFGDHLYYKPASFLGLSSEISSYYCALGSLEALSDALRQHRVGGNGRWHIFHFPQAPSRSLLQKFGNPGDRRESFSALLQIKHGATMSDTFPVYNPSDKYTNPLSSQGMVLEKNAVGLVTKDVVTMYLQNLTSLPTRSYSNSEASVKAEAFLQDHFAKMGIKSCLHNFGADGRTLTNVMAFIPGQKADSVTVGAHYDSRPFDGRAPGAEDNGSGVASLLSIASAYARSKIRPLKNVYFVLFAGEEAGLLGSEAFAQDLASGGKSFADECRPQGGSFLELDGRSATHSAIIMDEVGWRSNKPEFLKPTVNLESYDSSSDVMQHLVHGSRQYNGDALAVVHNSQPFGSDHMSFLNRGMHAVLTINGDDEAYPNYHQSSDTVDNVDPAFVAQISKMDMAALVRMSGVRSIMRG